MFLQQVARWKSKKRRRFRLQTNKKKKFTCTQLTHEHILSERSHIDLFLTQMHQQNHIYNKYNKLDTDPMHSQASSLWYPILNYHCTVGQRLLWLTHSSFSARRDQCNESYVPYLSRLCTVMSVIHFPEEIIMLYPIF